MRTTLKIDDDVLTAARELADSTGCSLGKAVSELARKGLNGADAETEIANWQHSILG